MEPIDFDDIVQANLSSEEKLEGFFEDLKMLKSLNSEPSSKAIEYKLLREKEVSRELSIALAQLEHKHQENIENPKSRRAWLVLAVYITLLCATLFFGYYVLTSDSETIQKNIAYLFAVISAVISGIIFNISKTIR